MLHENIKTNAGEEIHQCKTEWLGATLEAVGDTEKSRLWNVENIGGQSTHDPARNALGKDRGFAYQRS